MEKREQMNVLWFDELHRSDVNLVGGKSSSLGEMTSAMKIPVPYGFATTTHAYRQFMAETGLNDQINKLLAEINDYGLMTIFGMTIAYGRMTVFGTMSRK